MLAKCYECGKPISTDARRCPNCGYDYRDEEVFGDDFYVNRCVDDKSGGFRRMSVMEHRDMIEKYSRERKEKEQKEEEEARVASGKAGCIIVIVVAICVLIATVVSHCGA